MKSLMKLILPIVLALLLVAPVAADGLLALKPVFERWEKDIVAIMDELREESDSKNLG
jgi:uncharacterized membrane protein